jgi:hypothetical protein
VSAPSKAPVLLVPQKPSVVVTTSPEQTSLTISLPKSSGETQPSSPTVPLPTQPTPYT